jgi:hypothetical protein
VATQRGELGLMSLINLAAISGMQRHVATHPRLMPLLFYLAAPPPGTEYARHGLGSCD